MACSTTTRVLVSSTTTVPADITAANGLLVGNPSLIPGEQSCIQATPNQPWSPDSLAPFEVHDSDRTHLYGFAHFLGSTSSSSNTVFAYSSQQSYPTPYNMVDDGSNALFLDGGGYGDDPAASGSFVARVAPNTFDQVWRTVLINTNASNEWNYPGVLNILSDGSLIVIFGYHIAKLDPATGAIIQEATLPTGQSLLANTARNGYDALPDGTIIAKTVNREPGCTEQEFCLPQVPEPESGPAVRDGGHQSVDSRGGGPDHAARDDRRPGDHHGLRWPGRNLSARGDEGLSVWLQQRNVHR